MFCIINNVENLVLSITAELEAYQLDKDSELLTKLFVCFVFFCLFLFVVVFFCFFFLKLRLCPKYMEMVLAAVINRTP